MLTDQIIFGIAKQSINQYTEVCTTLHTTYVIAFFGIFHLQLFTFTPSLHEINLSHDVQKSRRRNNTAPKKGQKYNLISHDVRILSINTYLVPTYLLIYSPLVSYLMHASIMESSLTIWYPLLISVLLEYFFVVVAGLKKDPMHLWCGQPPSEFGIYWVKNKHSK